MKIRLDHTCYTWHFGIPFFLQCLVCFAEYQNWCLVVDLLKIDVSGTRSFSYILDAEEDNSIKVSVIICFINLD